jgi:hypothetical protein
MGSFSELVMTGLLRLLELIMNTATLLILLLDAMSFGQLLALTIVLGMVDAHVPPCRARVLASRTAAPMMLAYFGYQAIRVGDQWWLLLLSLFRSWLAYHTIASGLTPVLAIANAIRIHFWKFARESQRVLGRAKLAAVHISKWIVRFLRRQQSHREPIRPAATPPSRNERMRALAASAHAEFDSEVAVIQTLPLDDDEREILVLQAKQRLLQKLSRLAEV